MKMAMSVENSRHYRFDQIHGRHFVQTALRAGLSKNRARANGEEVEARACEAVDATATALSATFTLAIANHVSKAVLTRLGGLRMIDVD